MVEFELDLTKAINNLREGKASEKEQKCGWYAACNNCIDGSNYWRKNNGRD